MTGTLHIIAQKWPHQSALVIGDRAGLIALRNTLFLALSGGEASASVYANDGEGYGVIVIHREDMTGAPYGYTAEEFADRHPWPEWLVEAVLRMAG